MTVRMNASAGESPLPSPLALTRRPRDRHGTVDARREHDVARNPIALGDHEHARVVFPQGHERQTQGRTLGDRRDAAHA
jgi:hypothetical protein